MPQQERPELTGEGRDLNIDYIAKLLEAPDRVAILADLLDRVCIACASELPKFGPCRECGLNIDLTVLVSRGTS